jgi:hypothetical protein
MYTQYWLSAWITPSLPWGNKNVNLCTVLLSQHSPPPKQIHSDCLVNFHFIKLVHEVSIRWYTWHSCLTSIITVSHSPHTSVTSNCHPLCTFVTNFLEISQWCIKMKCRTYILVKPPPHTKFHHSLHSGSCYTWTFAYSRHIFAAFQFWTHHKQYISFNLSNCIISRNPKTIWNCWSRGYVDSFYPNRKDVSTASFIHKLCLSFSSCNNESATSVHSKSRKACIKSCHILTVFITCLHCTCVPCITQSVNVRQVIAQIRDTDHWLVNFLAYNICWSLHTDCSS